MERSGLKRNDLQAKGERSEKEEIKIYLVCPLSCNTDCRILRHSY